jgi:ABC-2 type transport system permease protein
MPIHDQGYRHYAGEKTRGRAWLIILTTGIRSMLRNRWWVALMAASWIQFLVRAVGFYFAANFSQAAIVAPSPSTFRDFLGMQDFWVFIMSLWLGARLIADDRRANALQIYLSKPLTRAEYVLGKFGILATFLLAITWLPAMLLLVVQVVFAGNFEFLRANMYLFPAITVFTFIEILMVSTAMLALSSLSTNSRFVAILYTVLIFFTKALAAVLSAVTRGSTMSWLSFGNNLEQVGDFIFRMPLRYQTPWPVSFIMIVALIAVSVLILERRIRGVEVVA